MCENCKSVNFNLHYLLVDLSVKSLPSLGHIFWSNGLGLHRVRGMAVFGTELTDTLINFMGYI